jgi:hypothetical protein
MTRELQHAMAQYEEARIRYRQAVLASLNGESSGGEAIREAIQAFQGARAELAKHGATRPGNVPVRAERERAEESGAWGLVRRLLHAS